MDIETTLTRITSSIREEEFYQGFSTPKNRELMRIFKDVRLVKHIGSGIPRILKKYDRSVFNFSTNFLRITYPFPESITERNEQNEDSKHPDKFLPAITGDKPTITNSNYICIMDYLKTHDSITSSEAMEVLNLKASQTGQILREMAERNLLEAQGENRNRYYVMSTEKPIFASSSALIGTYQHR